MGRKGWMTAAATVAMLAGSASLTAWAQPRGASTTASQVDAPEPAWSPAPPPSARDCEQFGYRVGDARDAYASTRAPSGRHLYASPPANVSPPPPLYVAPVQERVPTPAPPPPAPMPPPPPPSMAGMSDVEEVVVTASRVAPGTQNSAVAVGVAGGPPPGTVNRDRYPDAPTNRVTQVAEQPVSTFSIDVDTASYANARRHLREGRRPPTDAVRVEELINYFDYGYARPANRATPFRFTTALTPSPWNAGRQLMHVGVQGYAPSADALPPLNLVFLVDVSGSMQGEDRLELAKRSLDVLIAQLRPQDRVAMAVYAGSAGQVLPPTRGTEKLHMRCAVQALEAGGSTAGGAGLALAYRLAEQNLDRDAVNRVILMTDGDFNVGVTDDQKLEDFVAAKRKTGVYLSVYGFGGGNYNDALMQTIAQAGNGTAAYVDTLAESRKLFRDDFTASLFPIADDVKIQVEFNPALVSEYRLIGYETRLLNREDFNNDAVDAGEVGAGAAVTALYEITPVGARRSVDPLRYGAETRPRGAGDEVAHAKLRHKRPGEAESRLLEQPIGRTVTPLDRAPEATRWATAVAGYGQLLRGDANIAPRYGWADVIALAETSRGRDEDGLRREFITLARAAKDARTLND